VESDDGKLLLNVNPDSNSVSVFTTTNKKVRKIAEIPVGKEPVSVALTSNRKRAFVANSRDNTVTPINLTNRKAALPFDVGAEPMSVVLSPNDKFLYVANSSSNNIQVFDAKAKVPALITTIDLSSFGRSPRALAITDSGNKKDNDETLFVAMFFGQLRTGKGAVDEGQDDQREGRVVAIDTATNAVATTTPVATLAPMAATGFNSNGKLAPAVGLTPAVASTNPQTFTTPTGAFPNQLAAIAVHPTNGKAYVVSTGASPNGPLRFNHMAQGLVSVFDAATRVEVAAAQTDSTLRRTAPLNMNQGVNLDTAAQPRLFHTNPTAMAWRGKTGDDAWVVIQNTDLVVRLNVDANGIPSVGTPLVAGPGAIVRVDLQNPGGTLIPGKAPRGIAINKAGTRAFVSNFVSRSVSVLDLSNPETPSVIATALSSALPAPGSGDEFAQLGAELFYTGRGPNIRMSAEGWGGCIVCHPNGRSDNVTWIFDAGPRQTIPLDGMFNRTLPTDQRILNWSAVRDENQDFELNTRGVFGGRGLIDDDRLLLAIGGTTAGGDSGAVEQFQQATGAVTTTNDLSNGASLPPIDTRRDFAVATLSDDRVFIIGGRTGSGDGTFVTDAILEFNPRTNTLTTKSGTGFTPRHSLGAAAVRTNQGERIYAIGGYASTNPATAPSNLVEEYNPANNTWRPVATLPVGVAQFGVTVAGGVNTAEPLQLIHVVSGNTGTETVPTVVNPSPIQRFQADPAGPGTWSAFTPAGLTLRRNHGAATVFRGASSRVFVIGGQDSSGAVLDTVEEYLAQAVTAVSTPHTALPAPRARFGVSSSQSTNQIYVIGGVDDTAARTDTVFEYSVANNGPTAGPSGTPSGTWVTRANLVGARADLKVSTPPGVTNFLPVRNTGRDFDQDSIAAWIQQKIRSVRGAVPATDAQAAAGRAFFGQNGLVTPGFSCATCHGGPKWTRSQVAFNPPPSPEIGLGFGNERVIGAELRQTQMQPAVLFNVGTFTPNSAGGRVNEIRANGADPGQAIAPLGANGFNIPSLLSVSETGPYFYNGLAQTLDQVLDGSTDNNGGTRHHFVTDAAVRAQLIAFLRSIDDATALFP
jgi:YVTN family beta-propeller protein